MKDITGDIAYNGAIIRFMNADYYSTWHCNSPLLPNIDYEVRYVSMSLFTLVIFNAKMRRVEMRLLRIVTLQAL